MGQFDAFEAAQSERIEIAVREILRADPALHAFFDGRIVRLATPMEQVDLDIPYCSVSTPRFAPEFQFQQEAEDKCPVAITVLWSEASSDRARDIGEENTAKSLVRAILVALWANQHLLVKIFRDEKLVEALESISEIAYGKFVPGDEDDGDTPYRWSQVQVIYRYTLDLVTGAVPESE